MFRTNGDAPRSIPQFWLAWVLLGIIPLGFAQESTPEPGPTTSPLGLNLQTLTLESFNPSIHQSLIKTIIQAEKWEECSVELRQWLTQHYTPTNLKHPGWQVLSSIQEVCALVAADRQIYEKISNETLKWLLEDSSLAIDLFQNLKPKDRPLGVLRVLEDVRRSDPSRFPKYNRLALALALVWDTPRRTVPHNQVPSSAVPDDPSKPPEKFQFWVETNENRLASFDLSTLEVEQLIYIVDATAPLEDLKWAQRAIPFNRSNFERAYHMVDYDEKRIHKNVFIWPHPSYHLEEIKKRGGICVDQAYFAVNVGKASGIPTLFFSGEGRRGGHAWFGYMKSPDRWDMDCGRYRYDKYATGESIDPQTGQKVTDHELAFLAEPFRNTQEYRFSRFYVRQAELFEENGELPKALEALNLGIQTCSKNLDAWHAKSDLLQKEPFASDAKAYPQHLQSMIVQFARYPDIKTSCQQILADLARESGDPLKAKLIENQIVIENRNKRHDLSAEVFRDRINEAIRNREWKIGTAAVHDAIMKLRNETGTVYDLTHLFVKACIASSEYREADKVLKDFKARMKMDPLIANRLEGLQEELKNAQKKKK